MGITADTRAIVHLDLDAFFVSVERLKDSRLEGKPLIISGGGNRSIVSSCSYEARRFGVHSAMPLRWAQRLCPHAIVISGDHDAYSHYSQVVTEIVKEDAPLFEKASIDEFYIDMTGMERFYGCLSYAKELRTRINHETGLPLSFGLSANKMVAKVVTNEVKPNGYQELKPTEIQPFLAPLSVRKIPQVGHQTTQQLVHMGVRTIATLREIPRPVLERTFGKPGLTLYQRARGQDNRPVVPYSERKSISKETTFETDTDDLALLHRTLIHMVEQLTFKLRNEGKLTACLHLKLRFADFETVSKQVRLPFTANDAILIDKVKGLFTALYERRLKIRLIGIRFSRLVPGRPQIELFQAQSQQVELYDALDAIRQKYGKHAIGRGKGSM